MKTCRKCGEAKPAESFYRNAREPDGRHAWCKVCHAASSRKRYLADPERFRAEQRQRDQATQPQRRAKQLAQRYGLTLEQYEALWQRQDGRCAVCRRELVEGAGRTRATCVDHDHDTGAVRGLLCQTCNRALGLLGDNLEVVRRALDYLQTRTGVI